MKRRNVWSRDFTLITAGTVISAIAGQTISLPLSLMVFDQTQSALLSAIMFVSSMHQLCLAPFRRSPSTAAIKSAPSSSGLSHRRPTCWLPPLSRNGFNYRLFVFFSLVVGSIGSIYQLTYTAYLDLIPVGFEQQGLPLFIHLPTVIMVMSPVAAWLYKTYPFHLILIIINLPLLPPPSSCLWQSGSAKARRRLRWQDYFGLPSWYRLSEEGKGLRNIYSTWPSPIKSEQAII